MLLNIWSPDCSISITWEFATNTRFLYYIRNSGAFVICFLASPPCDADSCSRLSTTALELSVKKPININFKRIYIWSPQFSSPNPPTATHKNGCFCHDWLFFHKARSVLVLHCTFVLFWRTDWASSTSTTLAPACVSGLTLGCPVVLSNASLKLQDVQAGFISATPRTRD